LANKWKNENGNGCSATDLEKFQAKQKMFFIDTLITTATPMNHDLLAKLESCYHLSTSTNVEIVFRSLMLNLKSKVNAAKPLAGQFLAKYGRGLYVKPLYKALIELDREYARQVYLENRNFYHSIICFAIEGMLKR